MYSLQERETALGAAVNLFARAPQIPSAETVTAYATAFLGWVSGARLRLTVDPFTFPQGDPAHPQPTQYEGETVQLTDTQQVLLSVAPEDSKGQVTSDTLTWSTADPTVISLEPSADTLSCMCVAGVPGTGIVVTVTDGTISASESFDVVAGPVASLVITPGAPEDQPPVTPPAP